MKEMIVASNNSGKINEIKEIWGDRFIVRGMKEAGIHLEIEETGQTFEENARIKAKAIHDIRGGYVLADDSGLCIDALNGAPGIYSARFFGEEATYPQRFAAIFEILKDIPETKRTAYFMSTLIMIRPDGKELFAEGRADGLLVFPPRGENGFGYDPIFYLPEKNRTAAELKPEEKNEISHRGRALRKMLAKMIDS